MSRDAADDVKVARPSLAGAASHHVRHGDFKPVLDSSVSRNRARFELGYHDGTPLVVFAGQVRAYKGVPQLLRAASQLEVDVLVAGQCKDEGLKRELATLASHNPRASVEIGFLAAEALSLRLRAANLVVLPYRSVLNSGAAILALSAGRRILVPSTPTFDELAREVGEQWVFRYDGDLEPSDVEAALRDPEPTGQPDLSLYSWDDVSSQLEMIYAGEVHRKACDDPSFV